MVDNVNNQALSSSEKTIFRLDEISAAAWHIAGEAHVFARLFLAALSSETSNSDKTHTMWLRHASLLQSSIDPLGSIIEYVFHAIEEGKSNNEAFNIFVNKNLARYHVFTKNVAECKRLIEHESTFENAKQSVKMSAAMLMAWRDRLGGDIFIQNTCKFSDMNDKHFSILLEHSFLDRNKFYKGADSSQNNFNKSKKNIEETISQAINQAQQSLQINDDHCTDHAFLNLFLSIYNIACTVPEVWTPELHTELTTLFENAISTMKKGEVGYQIAISRLKVMKTIRPDNFYDFAIDIEKMNTAF